MRNEAMVRSVQAAISMNDEDVEDPGDDCGEIVGNSYSRTPPQFQPFSSIRSQSELGNWLTDLTYRPR